MKKIILIVPALIIALGLRASAETNQLQRESFQIKRQEQSERLRANILENKTRIEERRTEMMANQKARKVKLNEARKERLSGLFDGMFSGFAHASDRLEKIYNRLNEVVAEMESSGKDVAAAKELLAESKNLLDNTQAELISVQEEINKALEEDVNKEYLRSLISSVKESIRITHESFRAVISEINKQKSN